MAELPDIDSWQQGYEEDLNMIFNCYCPACTKSGGTTAMLPTKVPFFREIIVMSFSCEDCNFRNTEINFGGEIQEKGETVALRVTSADDLNRQIIKSDSCSMTIPQLQLEIPPLTQRGTMSTIEGMLKRAADNLESLQPDRLRLGDVDNFHRCKAVIESLRRYAGDVQEDDADDYPSPSPFDIILDDPAGNSFIENPLAPAVDPNLTSNKYFRTATQDMSIGLQPSQQAIDAGTIDDTNPTHKNPLNSTTQGKHMVEGDFNVKEEVMKFGTPCPHCFKPAETSMCLTDIPHFKEVIIMSLFCELCGFKSNEIKGGGAIPKYGTKIILSVNAMDDLAREVLKSDTAGLAIPELELELDEGGLDGVYTTVEGLLNKVHSRLQSANPFGSGDAAKKQHLDNDGGDFSTPSPNYVRYAAFLKRLKDCADGIALPFTLIITDPLSNSFIGPIPKDAIALSFQAEKDGNNDCYNDYFDPGMQLEEYERTHDDNEILGLNDINTENYQHEIGDRQNYGTDMMEDLPDRIRRLDVRGPDHPHEVGKAPVEGDDTVMGSKSNNFAVPGMAQRGVNKHLPVSNTGEIKEDGTLRQLLHKFERDDDLFRMNDEYVGTIEGMVFKDGAQGLGYYTDKSLVEIWEESQQQ
jgi:zinc finger protein